MNLVAELRHLKALKRNVKFTYSFLHTLYEGKLARHPQEEKQIYYEALVALDSVERMYKMLKQKTKNLTYFEQADIVEEWSIYISSIEALTAYRTNDNRLLSGVTMDEETARQTAIDIYRDFNRKVRSNNSHLLH